MRLTFKELKDEIAKIVPKSIDYRVDLEAGNIAIVTPVPEKFGGGDGLVGKIAKKIKRKIKIRPDPSIVKPELEAKSLIESIIPEEAEISQIYFDGCFSEVIIQCQNPGKPLGEEVRMLTKSAIKLVGFQRLREHHQFSQSQCMMFVHIATVLRMKGKSY